MIRHSPQPAVIVAQTYEMDRPGIERPMAVGVILIPVAAKTITKLIRKPVILPANRMLKSVGLDVKV